MDVIDHEPAAWHLLAEGERLFLDVDCGGDTAPHKLLVELTVDERRAFVLEGRSAIDRIALEISAMPEDFYDRNALVMELGDDAVDAIARFRETI